MSLPIAGVTGCLAADHKPVNCDPLARWYRCLEYVGFGRALQRRRLAFLSEITTARRVLVLGDGDGRFLAEFLAANPHAQVDAVDLSAKMLALARRRTHPHTARVRFHHADALSWSIAPAGYDLIITHYFLDCFTDEELRPLVARVTSCATPDARWVVSEFRQPPRGFAAWYARAWIAGLYAFFRAVTGLLVRHLPDHVSALEAAGYRIEREIVAHGGMLTSQLWRRD